jgi:hypothetical protein
MARRIKPRFRNLKALMSALAEGALTQEQVEQALAAVAMGVGLSKRDKALGEALESTGDDKDAPAYWDGVRDGLVQGYEGARFDLEAGRTLRPITELMAEAQAESWSPAPDSPRCMTCGGSFSPDAPIKRRCSCKEMLAKQAPDAEAKN